MALVTPRAAKAGTIQVFFTDFDGAIPGELSGVTTTAGVEGYAGDGFSGQMLWNATGGNPLDRRVSGVPGLPTTLTLTNLPEHVGVDVNFLLAIIDSWDAGDACSKGTDYFNVVADGTLLVQDSYGIACGTGEDTAPVDEEIGTTHDRGFDSPSLSWTYQDRAFDMTNDSRLFFEHTASTLTLQFFANGAGWQGGLEDESWGMDNLEVLLVTVDDVPPPPPPTPTPVPEPTTMLLVGGGLIGAVRRFRGSLRG
ncbi:MAG: PEP-CTERM sorting domain-containing protein [Vicinamibacterales bacterium]